LIRQWLEAGGMEDGTVRETLAGTPQGQHLPEQIGPDLGGEM